MSKRKQFGDPLARRSAGLTTGPEIAVALVGDYEDDVAERLRAIKRREAKGVRLGWENGRDLVALRDALAGSFSAVLADEFPHWSRSSAYDFIAFYETFPDLSQIEGLSMTTVRLLIRSTTPARARTQILDSVARGQPMTWKAAGELIERERLALLPPALTLDETIALIWRVLKAGERVGGESDPDRLTHLEGLDAERAVAEHLDEGRRLDGEALRKALDTVRGELMGRIEHAAQKAKRRSVQAAHSTSSGQAAPDTETKEISAQHPASSLSPAERAAGPADMPGQAGPVLGDAGGLEAGGRSATQAPTLPAAYAALGWELREVAPGSGRWYGFRARQGDRPGRSTGTVTDDVELAAALAVAEAGVGPDAGGESVDLDPDGAPALVALRLSQAALVALDRLLHGADPALLSTAVRAELRTVIGNAMKELDYG